MEAHVFQHSFTGAQMFIYHHHSEEDAREHFRRIVTYIGDWKYLGKKVAEYSK